MSWDQWVIVTFGVAGVVLAQTKRWQRYACFAGLLGQAGWFAAIQPETQPGIFMVSVIYCGAWLWGLYIHWIRPRYIRTDIKTGQNQQEPKAELCGGATSNVLRFPQRSPGSSRMEEWQNTPRRE